MPALRSVGMVFCEGRATHTHPKGVWSNEIFSFEQWKLSFEMRGLKPQNLAEQILLLQELSV